MKERSSNIECAIIEDNQLAFLEESMVPGHLARDVHVKASTRMIGLSLQPECQQFASNGVAFGLHCVCVVISTVRDTLWRSSTKVPPASLQVLGDIHTIDDCRSLKVVKKLGATEIVVEATQAAGSVRALTSTFTCGLCATSMGRRIMR